MSPREGVIVPAVALNPETLDRLIEEFVTREGTDYGLWETSLQKKCEAVKRQLDNGEAVIVYDPVSETSTIVTHEEAHRGLLMDR
jgi:uncharacterized protein YheU (UPF0270 family)